MILNQRSLEDAHETRMWDTCTRLSDPSRPTNESAKPAGKQPATSQPDSYPDSQPASQVTSRAVSYRRDGRDVWISLGLLWVEI